ncbi:hypothetical protein [Streptomyces sp. NBC_00564]|uniref:hypothetical protein n=1 Tax=Streptomyces sp. NBC_00564 TaxID=2903663 RepID=UPI00352F15E7|nr:hypothetical protein OG256_35870 [Streptomyces sp. NBC_00564]
MSDLGIPEEFWADIARAMLGDLTGRSEVFGESPWVDRLHFHVYSNSVVRRSIGYEHVLDTFG